MAKESVISKKYAEALALVKLDKTIIDELNSVKEGFAASTELVEFLANPAIQIETKKAALRKIFEGNVSKEVLHTLLLLLDRRRINLVVDLADNYREIFYAKSNLELAQISSTESLSDTEVTAIKAQLEKAFSKTVEVSTEIDESLIAGMKIRISNKVIDSSLKTKLKSVKDLLEA